jgi:hypothetical protein
MPQSSIPRRVVTALTHGAVALLLTAAGAICLSRAVAAQSKDATASQRITIPFLANATTPTELDYAAAECDLASNEQQMDCRFRQMFIVALPYEPTTCVVTTNGYERTFRRDTGMRWVSADAPVGECGVVDSTTLEDGGGTRWTMTIRSAATVGADRPECRVAPHAPQVYDWRGVKRALPCTSIQPGAIER